MNALESATEITKAWIAQQPRITSAQLAKELKEIFLAAHEAYVEALNK